MRELMDLAVLSVFGFAIAAPQLHAVLRRYTGWLLALVPAALFVYFLSFSGQIANGNPATAQRTWVPELGVSLSFYLDGLSLLFALLITGVGAVVLIYSGGYLSGHRDLGRFYAFVLLFMGAMLGVVLADNIFLLFIFWELTSISSYLLIGFDHEDPESRASAQQALIVTNLGGMGLLGGLVLLGQAGETAQLSALAAAGDAVRDDGLYLPILMLVLAGAFTKSAQVPFHFWLPGAMAAPTPVSAYLHSATMVKAGIYLLARLSPALGDTDEWKILLTGTGASTMIVGGLLAFFQTDLKRTLAYSTISALGALVLLLGLGTPEAATAAMVFLVAHALYKGALFMVVGVIDHGTGTRNLEQLRGLRHAMPITASVAVLAAVSLAGFGPLLGFVGKELLLEAVLGPTTTDIILVVAVVAAGALFVVVAGLAGFHPFLGKNGSTPTPPHEAPWSLLAGPAVLAFLGLVFGLAPGMLEERLVAPAVAAVRGGEQMQGHLALWHGVNAELVLSLVSVALGVAGYFAWRPIRAAAQPLGGAIAWGPERCYAMGLRGVLAGARAHTRLMQNGYLRAYLAVTILTAVGLGGFTLVTKAGLENPGSWDGLEFYHVGLAVMMVAGALATAVTDSRLAAVAALGVIGYGVAVTYILFGAPDLAMTQVMVETLTVILFLSVLYHLPNARALSGSLSRARDVVIALSAGVFMTALVLVGTANRAESELASFYADQSVPLAHGRNVVNVILVDFRALDTLGEITVLAVAAFGVYALLRWRGDASPERGDDS
jgi:multicomponent Na+:H+ antiporter subunit A